MMKPAGNLSVFWVTTRVFCFLCCFNASPWTAVAATYTFSQPECITEAYHPQVQSSTDPYYRLDNYRMSRNPGSAISFDSSGMLHLTYWSGSLSTTPDMPAAVYYQSWSEDRGWSQQEKIDDSYNSEDPAYEGRRMGGRHPNLTVDGDDTVWVVWNDYRHCSVPSPNNSNNNIEIYYDAKQAAGSFSSEDVRLTETNAVHTGDNGYNARIQAASDGKMTVLWYDFNADYQFSDIYMLTSDSGGVFDTSLPMSSRRITKAEDRTAIPPQILKPAFNMPDLIITPEGKRYAVWSQNSSGTGNGIHFAELQEQPSTVSYSTISDSNDGYWYPPKIKLAPNGDLWVVYTVLDGTTRRIEMLRRPAEGTDFGSPIIPPQEGSNKNADLAIDNDGNLHLVWTEDGGYRNTLIRYAMLDGSGENTLKEIQLTSETGAWAKPCITLRDGRIPFVVFCEGDTDTVGAEGNIWFVRAEEVSAVEDFQCYE